jgi:FixJ family two-component response regulator
MCSPPVVYIVDDDPGMRRALERLLQNQPLPGQPCSVRAFGSATEFLAEQHDPDQAGCIILDLMLPELSGLEVQECLLLTGCHRPVIFLSGKGDIAASVRAMKVGAVDFLTKPVETAKLLGALQEALDIDARRREARSQCVTFDKRLSTLTPREHQVFEQVVAGRLNKQIAADLGTVEKTIKVHRARVMQKMGVRSLAELIRFAATAARRVPRLGAAPPATTFPHASPW